jgi:adenylate kinase
MNLIVLGPPRAGKGTLGQRLEANRGLKYLSTGDMLRTEVAAGSELGAKLKTVMDAGQSVPSDVMVAMIAARIGAADCAGGFTLDGFPRTLAQAETLDTMLEEREFKLDHVIQIMVNQEVLVERISGRMACDQCGMKYHAVFDPPHFEIECDDCGPTKFVRRPEDEAETVRAGLIAYDETIAPLLPYYAERGVLTDVDGVASADGVAKQIEELLDEV